MKLLTPAEYADAYRFWTQQQTRTHALEVEQQIAPHVTWALAEKHRQDALMRYRDTPQQQAHRLAEVTRELSEWVDTRRKAAA